MMFLVALSPSLLYSCSLSWNLTLLPIKVKEFISLVVHTECHHMTCFASWNDSDLKYFNTSSNLVFFLLSHHTTQKTPVTSNGLSISPHQQVCIQFCRGHPFSIPSFILFWMYSDIWSYLTGWEYNPKSSFHIWDPIYNFQIDFPVLLNDWQQTKAIPLCLGLLYLDAKIL